MTYPKLLMAGLLFLLVFSSVSFAQNDHEFIVQTTSLSQDYDIFSASQELSLCSCATVTDSIIITNRGTFTTTLQLDTNLDYVTLSQQVLSIDPQQQQQIILYIKAPCHTLQGDELVVTVTPVVGEQKTLTKTLEFLNCQNLRVDVLGPSQNLSVCEPFSTSFSVTNTGSFTDTFTITPQSYSNEVTLSTQQVTLAPMQSRTVQAAYLLPCDVYGEVALDMMVSSQGSARQATFSRRRY
jgi:hypothetical protein